MDKYFEKYLFHPAERPVGESDAKIELIRSRDNPIMGFFYESAFLRGDCAIFDRQYALPYEEMFCFVSTTGDDTDLGATVSITVNGRKFTTDRNFMIEIPALVPHGEIKVRDVKSPVFFFCTGPGKEHVSLPEFNWKTEGVPAVEDMVIFYNGDREDPDRKPSPDRHIVLQCLAEKTLPGDINAVLRRFESGSTCALADGHIHDFPQMLCFYGCDPDRPYELGGEFTVYLGGEKYTIDRPTVCYVGPSVIHGPISVEKIDRPVIRHSVAQCVGEFTSTPIPGMEIGTDGTEMEKPW